jgi:hypothetical protein
MRGCFLLAALLMFYAGQAWASRPRTDYAVTGTFHIVDDDAAALQSCALYLGTATGRADGVIVLTIPSRSTLGQFCRDHAGEHGRLTVAASPAFLDVRGSRDGARP